MLKQRGRPVRPSTGRKDGAKGERKGSRLDEEGGGGRRARKSNGRAGKNARGAVETALGFC